jgi:Fic family protein
MPVPYHLGKFPPRDIDWPQLIPLIGPASSALARYDGVLSAVPNAHVLATPLTTEEAVLSSKIEGTQATMGEVLRYEAEGDSDNTKPDKKADIQEVLNYRQALNFAEDQLRTLPLCLRLIQDTHSVLMQGVRGNDKEPGQFRSRQNWIGEHGCTIDTARFVPINTQHLMEGLSKWEKFIHDSKSNGDILVQLAILHAEFESLHPFLDGNGRLGRMLIPLYLSERKVLAKPCFYLSSYLEAHREEYYDRLLLISRSGDWTGWCRFFLSALIEQAKANTEKAQGILSLYDRTIKRIQTLTHSQFTHAATEFLFHRPVFKSTAFINESGITTDTARVILTKLTKGSVIRSLSASSGRRPGIFCFPELLNIAEGRKAF